MKFYALEISRTSTFVECSEENDWDSIRCPVNAGHRRAGRRCTILFLDVVSPTVVDFSRTMLSDIVITDKVFQIVREARLSGFHTQPTSIQKIPLGLNQESIPTLLEFVVTGKGGPADTKSGIKKISTCPGCGLSRYSAFEHGIVVDEAVYDGSDFFTVDGYPKYILVSERAKEVMERAGLSNVKFVEAAELQWPKGVNKPRQVSEC